MKTKPNVKEEEIINCLHNAYNLDTKQIIFLPLGADPNTAVYSVSTTNSGNNEYFLKLRSGDFNEAVLSVPKYLFNQGLNQVIPPLTTRTGELWTNLASFKMILYLYIKGKNGIEVSPSDSQWIELGHTVNRIHCSEISPTLKSCVQRETFTSKWRETVIRFLNNIEVEKINEPVAIEMALFLKSKKVEIVKIVERAEKLASILLKGPPEFVLCHADIHGWNLLIDNKNHLYLVDWDTLIFAPKERDLMFIGAGIWNSRRTPKEEEILFYQGYGQTNVNQIAIAYYRYERIIEDIGVYCEQIFLTNEGGEDRIESFEYLRSNFLPGGPIERAYQSDQI